MARSTAPTSVRSHTWAVIIRASGTAMVATCVIGTSEP